MNFAIYLIKFFSLFSFSHTSIVEAFLKFFAKYSLFLVHLTLIHVIFWFRFNNSLYVNFLILYFVLFW